jgi:tRNA pseudouridine55 synthase
MAPREVTVHRFELLAHQGDRAEFLIECSAGTYVRSLIAELGDAYCVELRRTRIGPFDVEEADPTRVLPLDQALAFMPRVEVDPDAAWRAAHGQAIAGAADADHVLLADADGPVAIARPDADGLLRPVVGFRG